MKPKPHLLALALLAASTTPTLAQNTPSPDAKLYTEVKTAMEKYESSLKKLQSDDPFSPDFHYNAKPDPNAKSTNPLADLLTKCDLLIKNNPTIPDYYRLRGMARYYKSIDGTPAIFLDPATLPTSDVAAKYPPEDVAAAIKDFSNALSINPAAKLDDSTAAQVHIFRGKLYAISSAQKYSKQDLQNAVTDFSESAKLDDYSPPPNELRKGIYLASKDGDLVSQDLEKRIKENPAAAGHLYLERAAYLSQVVEYSKVLADLLRYSAIPGNNSPADKSIVGLQYATLNKLAAEAYKNKSLSTGIEYLEKASLEVQFPEKETDALSDATQAVKLTPSLTSAHVIMAKVLASKGKLDEAMAEANLALTQDPDNVGALCVRGLLFALKNDIHTLDDFNRAIDLDPELAFLYNAFGNRARIFTALNKPDLATADTQKAEQLAQRLADLRK